VGTDRVLLALRALQETGFDTQPGGCDPARLAGGWLARRGDFHATLAACFIDRASQRELFDQAFGLFWRDPDLLGRLLAMRLPQVRAKQAPDAQPQAPQSRRLADAMLQPRRAEAESPPRLELDAELTWSERELLHHADFETMSAEEWRAAQRALREMRLAAEPLPTRRSMRAPHPGRADWRATLAAMSRQGGDIWTLRFRKPRTRPAPMVVLADISGSMSRYSRMLLHFAHTLSRSGARVESFVFGTRLTRITHAMRQRDPDVAIAQVMRDVADWSGGTRITACLHEFNRRWARRVLSSRTTVLLISDGLEHGDTAALNFEMERLHKSCRRLLWLNPLLRFDGFEPKAAGIRAMLPHVDAFVPAHNVASLEELAHLLASPASAAP
jgi:uncharacterized protein with von Willebrand factor type A (vWA) domain